MAKARSGAHAIVPGKIGESELLKRILTDDASERMPPAKTKKVVTPAQIELLKRWIAEGANYQEHWAFVTAKRPALPKVSNPAWVRNGIDAFILSRLDREELKPSPEADRTTLIRRLSLDLTGLPPTPEDVDAFLADKSANAYEKLVDRLMASPHYGERLAVDWLDAARYADTHGYHIDAGRDMTRWREYVIDAFQQNLPFDRFTVEQLAGDLLPNATLKQRIASGFNRNHMINFEGGAIPEEYHNAYIVDRVVTTGTVWLGLTLSCAQCHDHKYDPISQREFYQLYAFFHNVPESGLDGSRGNASPSLKAPSLAQEKELARIEQAIAALEKQAALPNAKIDAAMAAWEQSMLARKPITWTVLDLKSATSRNGSTLTKQPDQSVLATGANPGTDSYTIEGTADLARVTGFKLEALLHAGQAGEVLGRSQNGNVVMTEVGLAVNKKPAEWKTAVAEFSQDKYPIANAIDGNPSTGWGTYPNVKQPNHAIFVAKEPLAGVAGKADVSVRLDFDTPYGQHQFGRVRILVTDADDPLGKETLPPAIIAILKTPRDKRAEKDQAALRTWWLQHAAGPNEGGAVGEIARLKKAKGDIESKLGDSMVMAEMGTPRDTYMLMRGEYNKRGEKVKAAVPAFLPPMPADAPVNRLSLARWLVDPRHPLTSRVTVNRYWQMIFGTGLVKTVEDFGSQAETPSHAELLDWLAVEFMDPSADPMGAGQAVKWSVRDLIRLMVTSSTYRQSSVVRPEHLAKDKDNRLLARGPRYRLQAEFIRDQALAVSGLLNREIGGKSVSPYQPEGLWQELASRGDSGNWSAQVFVLGKGKDLYRRTMYTFWKRASPPPQLVTFDAPDREVCTVRRSRTNTPLQALILMNDPTYVEASRKLAERLLREAKTDDERITLAFRLLTSRPPTERESGIVRAVHAKQLARFRADAEAAKRLLAVGQSPRDESLPEAELAAWTMAASVMLNIDEAVTKY
ncbi:MAG: PSD1 and planctomycete cytochrome C domain-containing protein [Gemmataceae bacterium]